MGDGFYVFDMARGALRRQLLGFPLLLAFLAAPPRTHAPLRAALIGIAVLTVVFLLGVTAYVWGEIAPILNPALAPADAPRMAILAAEPLHPAVAQLVLLGRYAGMSIAPLLAAILVWAAVNPQGAAEMFAKQEEP
ncbi:exosortase H-associated membrane protein [Brevundimonas naejangsanensis]|uniref:exosortase H-associated membrane protein n=1 Tax=Brevundimonas naejangsanensis TaxID=588932 RepID=UPI000EE99A58|nr:exosortase H-associated membrane protein [Brevundimonas naejangsanensis]HAC00936.1 hypothetical protein [Brevundimonas sp.]HCW49481.1 hypothetical protein [Brevundimonas sp.]